MTEQSIASAPGKVVLSGAYAVLSGAPAICMAVDRRAVASVEETGDDHHVVVAPGHIEEPQRFRVRDGVFAWLDSGSDFGLLEQVWRASNISREGGLSLRLDTTAFFDAEQGGKIGIGSSAALTVALASVLTGLAPGRVDPVAVAHEGHLGFQGGLGSGVDIATSAAGGLVEYRMQERAASKLTMPAGLECRFLWSGAPASTGKKLQHLSSRGPQPSLDALVVSAKRVASAWESGSAEAVLSEYREYIEALQQFSTDHDLGVFDAGHSELAAMAAHAGLVYKPCGAGGGDVGVLLADNAERADEFIAANLPGGFRELDLQVDEIGAQRTEVSSE